MIFAAGCDRAPQAIALYSASVLHETRRSLERWRLSWSHARKAQPAHPARARAHALRTGGLGLQIVADLALVRPNGFGAPVDPCTAGSAGLAIGACRFLFFRRSPSAAASAALQQSIVNINGNTMKIRPDRPLATHLRPQLIELLAKTL
jgi:hypothetical protein